MIDFERECRTAYSESYTVLEDGGIVEGQGCWKNRYYREWDGGFGVRLAEDAADDDGRVFKSDWGDFDD